MYYHGIVNGLVSDKVINILENGELSSATRMGESKRIGFNENDYISVCVNLGDDVYENYPNNAFNKYIVNHFCFVIDGSVDAIKTEFIPDAKEMSGFDLNNLRRFNPDKRFSDIVDEYQIRDYVPLDKVIAIGIPYGLEEVDGLIKLSNFCFLTRDEFETFIKQVEEMASDNGLEVVDSTSKEFSNMFENMGKEK